MYPDTHSLIAAVANRCFRYGSNFNRHRGFFWLSDRRCQVSSIHCICSSDFRWKWILAQDLQDLSWKTWPKMPKSNKHTDVWVRNRLDNHGMPRKKSGHFTNKTHWKRPQERPDADRRFHQSTEQMSRWSWGTFFHSMHLRKFLPVECWGR